MGGKLDWAALPLVAEMLGVIDIESFIFLLATRRDWDPSRPPDVLTE